MSIHLTSEVIVIDRIKTDRRPNEENVQHLMTSIPVVGVLQPIVLHRPGTGLGCKLVFGRDRMEACKRLKQKSIVSRVLNGDSDEIRAWIAQAQRDENAIRSINVQSRPALKLVASS